MTFSKMTRRDAMLFASAITTSQCFGCNSSTPSPKPSDADATPNSEPLMNRIVFPAIPGRTATQSKRLSGQLVSIRTTGYGSICTLNQRTTTRKTETMNNQRKTKTQVTGNPRSFGATTTAVFFHLLIGAIADSLLPQKIDDWILHRSASAILTLTRCRRLLRSSIGRLAFIYSVTTEQPIITSASRRKVLQATTGWIGAARSRWNTWVVMCLNIPFMLHSTTWLRRCSPARRHKRNRRNGVAKLSC